MNNANNIEVFKDTLQQIKEKYPIDPKRVKCYSGLCSVEHKAPTVPIMMVQGGTVSTGYAYADKMKVAILNFADALVPGGRVTYGSNAQEENICRCTNLYDALDTYEAERDYYAPNRDANKREPGIYTDRLIYAKDVIAFKDDTTYENIVPRKFDVITCPSPSTEIRPQAAMHIYLNRITQIILSAIHNKADCLVLGAWGCGAFGQDPTVMASSFAIILNDYAGYFKKIIFAIRATPNHTDSSFGTFSYVLSKTYRGGITYGEE